MLVLASTSPRRQQILQAAGIPFVVRANPVEEVPKPNESSEEYVRRLAQAKAEAVSCGPDEIVLGADTTVVIDNQILEKPTDHADAVRMLTLLQGRQHIVITGISLRSPQESIVDAAFTTVQVAAMSALDIVEYVASEEPMGKAGAYAIQGLISKYITGIAGCYLNVVGLPVSLVFRHLRRLEGRKTPA